MGKKAKTSKGKAKAESRKLDRSHWPKPPPPVENELGSAKLLDEPKAAGNSHKALDRDGFDDGGVSDLTLVIDLDDNVLRRKRGDAAFFTAARNNLLPRVTSGALAHLNRRDQKIKLAKILFSDDDTIEDNTQASEVYMDFQVDEKEDDEAAKQHRQERLNSAKFALRLGTVLREPACCSLGLAEISKRYLNGFGKEGAENGLRCAKKAIEIAGDGFYDSDLIAIEADDKPKIDEKHEVNATSPGLSHPTTLKVQPLRVSQLCFRSAYLHCGNALRALGREAEARETYAKVLPMLENEPRCGRLDWERMSIIVNIGNTYSAEGDYAKAEVEYIKAEKLGQEHIDADQGSVVDGLGIVIAARRAKSFALKRNEKDEEAKKVMREVLDLQTKLNEKKKEEEEAEKKLEAELSKAPELKEEEAK